MKSYEEFKNQLNEASGEQKIYVKVEKKGPLHDALNIPEGQIIPLEVLEKARKHSDPKIAKKAKIAYQLRRGRGNQEAFTYYSYSGILSYNKRSTE